MSEEVQQQTLSEQVTSLVRQVVAERDQALADLAAFAQHMNLAACARDLCDDYDDVVDEANRTLVNKVKGRDCECH